MESASFKPSACSKHPEKFLQHYCRSCRELLCIRCLANNNAHLSHGLIDYKQYLIDEQRKGEELLHQLNELLASAGKFTTSLSNAVDDFEQSCKTSEECLSSFDIVKEEMNKWQKNLLSDLENQKTLQMNLLDTAIGDAQNDVALQTRIKFPKVTIHKPVRNKLQEKAHELVPQNFLLFEVSLNRYNSTSVGQYLYASIDESNEQLYDDVTDGSPQEEDQYDELPLTTTEVNEATYVARPRHKVKGKIELDGERLFK